MPSINIPVFAFAACYVGNYSASAVMSPVTDLRTNGAQIKEDFPTDFIVALDNRIQSGNHTFDVTLSFLSDSILVNALSLGRPISTTSDYTPPGNQQYSLLLVDPFGNDSYYFPKISTLKSRATEYSKSKPVTTEITFRAESRSGNTVLAYQAPVSTLIPILSSISPF